MKYWEGREGRRAVFQDRKVPGSQEEVLTREQWPCPFPPTSGRQEVLGNRGMKAAGRPHAPRWADGGHRDPTYHTLPSDAGRVEQQADKEQTLDRASLYEQGTLGSDVLVWGRPLIVCVTSGEPPGLSAAIITHHHQLKTPHKDSPDTQ